MRLGWGGGGARNLCGRHGTRALSLGLRLGGRVAQVGSCRGNIICRGSNANSWADGSRKPDLGPGLKYPQVTSVGAARMDQAGPASQKEPS